MLGKRNRSVSEKRRNGRRSNSNRLNEIERRRFAVRINVGRKKKNYGKKRNESGSVWSGKIKVGSVLQQTKMQVLVEAWCHCQQMRGRRRPLAVSKGRSARRPGKQV